MNILLQSGRSEAIVAVYLHEQQWDDAIAVAEKTPTITLYAKK